MITEYGLLTGIFYSRFIDQPKGVSIERKITVGSSLWHRLPACDLTSTGWKPMPLIFRTMLSLRLRSQVVSQKHRCRSALKIATPLITRSRCTHSPGGATMGLGVLERSILDRPQIGYHPAIVNPLLFSRKTNSVCVHPSFTLPAMTERKVFCWPVFS